MSNARIEALSNALAQLGTSDRTFAADLIANFGRRKDLSDKQWIWVETLTQRALTPVAAAATESLGDFSGVLRLFGLAKTNLKHPKITLQVGGQPIQLSLAGARSKYEGQVQVTDGRPYGENVWFGRVDTQGIWTQGRSATEETLSTVREFLHEFSCDPAGTAKKHGRLTGRCCFCNTQLKDEQSTAAGFGPTCAKNYGLHSEWKSATAVLDQAIA